MKQAVCYPLVSVAIAALCLSGCLEIPGSEVINSNQGEHLVERCQRIPLSKGFSGGVPAEFELLVWNIHKQQHVSWQPELTRLAANSDLLLLQEAVNTDELVRWFAAQGWQWQQSVAFAMRGILQGCSPRPKPVMYMPVRSAFLNPLSASQNRVW